MPPTYPRRYSCTLTHSVTQSRPAARTFVVCVYKDQSDDPDEREVYIYPVQAIRTLVVDNYRALDREPEKGPDHRTLISNGWLHVDQEVVTENLIQSLDYGLVDAHFALGDYPGRTHRVIACTWPESEDRARFMGVAQDILRESEPCTGVLGTLNLDHATGLYEEQTAAVDEPNDDPPQRDVDLLMRSLSEAPAGLTTSQITNDVFKRNQPKGSVDKLLTTLHAKGMIRPVKSKATKGRAGRPAVICSSDPPSSRSQTRNPTGGRSNP